MIFKPVLVDRVMDGRKTRTTRFTTHQGGRDVRYRVGGVYAVQPGRGKHHVAHIEILTADVHPLGRLTPEQAREEGFPLEPMPDVDDPAVADFEAVSEFEHYWAALHGEYDHTRLVASYTFKRVDNCDDCYFW